MNRNSKRLSIYISLMLLGTVAAVALRTAALFSSLDEWGYFGDKGLITSAVIVAVATSVVMLTYGFIARKAALTPSFSSPATYVPTGILGVAVIFMLSGFVREIFELLAAGHSPSAIFSRPFGISLLIAIPLSLTSLIHLFLGAYLTEGHTTARAWASLGTVLLLAAYSAVIYFSADLPINSPSKLTDELAFLAATAFFLFESRISLGREMWRGYATLGLIAAHLTAFSSVPSLIFYAVRGEVISRSIEESVLCFALFIFISSRLILTVKLREDEPTEGIIAIRAFADARAEATAEATERHAHAFAIQMTIDDLIAEEGTAPLLIAEESEPATDGGESEDSHDDDDVGLDAISIFDTDEVMRAAVSLPDPEPAFEPMLVISDVDTADMPEGKAESGEQVAEIADSADEGEAAVADTTADDGAADSADGDEAAVADISDEVAEESVADDAVEGEAESDEKTEKVHNVPEKTATGGVNDTTGEALRGEGSADIKDGEAPACEAEEESAADGASDESPAGATNEECPVCEAEEESPADVTDGAEE